LLEAVPMLVAVPTGGDDVLPTVFTTVLSGFEVLGRALERLGLSGCDAVGASKCLGVVFPHGPVAIDAAA
jgi:hypothetical protein